MATSPQHPFTVELQDGTVVGGAQVESDAVTLAAGAVAVARGTLLVRDSSSGSVVAQIGRIREAQEPAPQVGPQLQAINPASTAPGLAPQVLTCTGSGFQDGADILWDGVAQQTTFDDQSSVSARLDIEAGDSGEQVPVQVRNPDGNTSGTVYFTWE
jgi:hypothetical protein